MKTLQELEELINDYKNNLKTVNPNNFENKTLEQKLIKEVGEWHESAHQSFLVWESYL
jgi:hypothetical protein